jgi:DNA-binding transcriptional MerR regulator
MAKLVELLTTGDVAHLTMVSPQTIINLANRGILEPILTPRGQRLFEAKAVDQVREHYAREELPKAS